MGAPAQFLFKPGERPVGRTAGTPNKLTSYVRNVLAGAFAFVGGEEAFYKWAKKNPTHFYTKLWIKLLPESSELSDEERERVLDAMLGVRKVLTEEYIVKSVESEPTVEIDSKTHVDASTPPSPASTDAPQSTISHPSDPNPAP